MRPVTMMQSQWKAKSAEGKNLVRVLSDVSIKINNVNITGQKDGGICFNGTASSSGGRFNMQALLPPFTLKPGVSYYFSCAVKGEQVSFSKYLLLANEASIAASKFPFTPTEEMSVRVGFNVTSGVTYNNMVLYPMVEASDSPTDFEPHYRFPPRLRVADCKGGYFSTRDEYGLAVSGVTSLDGTPSVSTPIAIGCVKAGTKISCCGKNLIPPKIYTTDYAGLNWESKADGSVVVEGLSTAYSALELAPFCVHFGETYSISGELPANLQYEIRLYNSAEVALERVYVNTFTVTNADAVSAKLRIKCSDANVSIAKTYIYPQVSIGDTPSEYEPYISGGEITTPCDLYDGDIFYPMSGRVKRVNRIIKSYNGESVSGEYVSSTGGLTTGATVVYKLSSPVIENYTPQVAFAPRGFVNIFQSSSEHEAGIGATLLVRR